jgi:glycosyltransferase involved in cell wall biosynthesis
MRALHIFPLFAADLTDGASHYQYILTKRLAERGVDVEVWTTRTRELCASAAFGIEWPDADIPTEEVVAGIPVRRFSASLSPSLKIGRAISKAVLHRWGKEDTRRGRILPGSRNLVPELHRRAEQRPRLYDWASLLGRGPNPPELWTNLLRHGRDYDVILVGFAPFALPWTVSHIARWIGRPCVVLPLFHPDDPYHHFASLYRSFARADAVLSQTPHSTALLRQWLPAARPVEIGVGVDTASYRDASIDGAGFRARHGLAGKRIVLMVGRKEPAKRWTLAVDAIERLADDDVRLVMIGGDADGVPIDSKRVLFLGKVDDAELRDAYDACDLLVHPSAHESFGFVFLEAWMREKPVIGNRLCGPVSTVIEEGRDGFLVVGASEMAARIRELLDAPELSARLGRAGREKAETRYDWDVIAARVAALYDELVGTTTRA